ncbi:MAG: transglutaminase domain-containing protein [Bacteroidota bacterium]
MKLFEPSMKRTLYLTLLLMITIVSQADCRQQLFDSLQVKSFTKEAPRATRHNLGKLATYLTENDSSNAQKALNIYTWIIHNVRYDYNAIKKIKSRRYYTVKQTLRKRKGICYQYANLFTALCEEAGVTSLPVVGYSRGQNFNIDDSFYEAGHAWNAVKLGGAWYFVDPTWGSGYLTQKKQWLRQLIAKIRKKELVFDRYKYLQNPTYSHCFVSPEQMLTKHLPADPTWQLVEYPVSLGSFESDGWQGYQFRRDSLTAIVADLRKQNETLDRYTRMSPLQYQDKIAFNAFAFNPKNHSMLAYSNYNIAATRIVNSVNPKEVMAGNKEAIRYLIRAKKQCNKHMVSIRKETTAIRKRAQARIKAELEKRVALRIKKQKRQLLNFDKYVRQWEVEAARYDEKYSTLKNTSNGAIRSLGTYRKSGNIRKSLVKKNTKLLAGVVRRSDSLMVVSDTLLLGLQRTVKSVPPLGDSVVFYNAMINRWIVASTQRMIADRPFEEISETWRVLDSLAAKMDVLDTALNTNLLAVRTVYKNVDRILKTVRAEAINGQKFIVANCKLTGGESCERAEYSRLDELIQYTYHNRAIALATYFQMVRSNFLGMKNLVELHKEQKELLSKNSDYIQQVKSNRLGGINFARAKSLFEMFLLSKKIEKAQMKLVRDNKALAIKVAESR